MDVGPDSRFIGDTDLLDAFFDEDYERKRRGLARRNRKKQRIKSAGRTRKASTVDVLLDQRLGDVQGGGGDKAYAGLIGDDSNELDANLLGANVEDDFEQQQDDDDVWDGTGEEPPTQAERREADAYFFICGVGMSMGWYSVSGAIAYFAMLYGGTVYNSVLAAYNAPALLLLLAQAKYDAKYDKQFGSRLAVMFRSLTAYAVLFTCTILAPELPDDNLPLLLFVVATIGVFDSVAYGSNVAFAGRVGGNASLMIFMGQSMSSVILLIITLSIDFGADPSQGTVRTYFDIAAIIIAASVAVFLRLANSRIARYYLDERPADDTQQLLEREHSSSVSSEASDMSHIADHTPSTIEVFKETLHLQLGIIILWTSILAIQSFFSDVYSDDPAKLSQILVYTNLFGQFLGKQLVLVLKNLIKTPQALFRATLIYPGVVFVFYLYLGKHLGKSDAFVILLVAVVAISGAFLSSIAYRLIGFMPAEKRQPCVAALNTSLMCGILGGISTAFICREII